MPYRHVLLATDFSNEALSAAHAARTLATPDASWTVAFVQPAEPAFAPLPPHGAYDAELRDWTDGAGLRGEPCALLHGPPGPALADEAKRRGCDLLALGARGHGLLSKLLLGSVARSALRAAPIDALVARPMRAPRRILVATDFFGSSQRAALRAREIAERAGAQTRAMHVVDGRVWERAAWQKEGERVDLAWISRTYERRLTAFAAEHLGPAAESVLRHGSAPDEIAREAAAWQADLVVLGTHGAHGLERVLIGSVAEAVAERAPCSVLVVRA